MLGYIAHYRPQVCLGDWEDTACSLRSMVCGHGHYGTTSATQRMNLQHNKIPSVPGPVFLPALIVFAKSRGYPTSSGRDFTGVDRLRRHRSWRLCVGIETRGANGLA